MRRPDTLEARLARRRWQLTSDERRRIARVYDTPLSKGRLGRLVVRHPRLGLEIVRAMAKGAIDAVSTGSSVMWAIDAERIREAVPDAASGVSWSGGDRFLEVLMKHVTSEMRVSDLGCGAGRFARDVASVASEVVCVDSSATLLREARAQLAAYRNVRYVQNVGWAMPEIADSSIDTVFSQGLFGYIEPRAFVSLATDVKRVLKPGGTFLFTAYTFERGQSGGRVRESLRRAASRSRVHSGIPEPFTAEFVLALLDLADLDPPRPSDIAIDPDGFSVFAARRRLTDPTTPGA